MVQYQNRFGVEGGEAVRGAKPIVVGSSQFVVAASIGVAVYPLDGATADELIKNADTAMYRAKKKNESSGVFFDREQESASA